MFGFDYRYGSRSMRGYRKSLNPIIQLYSCAGMPEQLWARLQIKLKASFS